MHTLDDLKEMYFFWGGGLGMDSLAQGKDNLLMR